MGSGQIPVEQADEFLGKRPREILNFIKATEIFPADVSERIGASFPDEETKAVSEVDLACSELQEAIDEQGLFNRLNEDPKFSFSDGESDDDDE